MTRTERLVLHGAELQKDLNELRTAYADFAQQSRQRELVHEQVKELLNAEKENSTYYKTLAHKLSEKLDMMETAVCNLVSMMFKS